MICDAIDLPAITPNMRLLCLELGDLDREVAGAPADRADIEALCKMLDLDVRAADSARDTMGDRLMARAPWLRALVWMSGAAPGLQAWLADEPAALETKADARQHLDPWVEAINLKVDNVLDACRMAYSTAEFRERLHLDFATFNRALLASGGAPDTDIEEQRRQLRSYVSESELSFLGRLIGFWTGALPGYTPAPDYAAARKELGQLAPAPDWLLTYRDVPDEVLAAHLESWLEAVARRDGVHPGPPRDVALARNANAPAIGRFATVACPLVQAWCAKHKVDLPSVWADAGQADGRLSGSIRSWPRW